jgi:hypothetical protein
MFIDFGLSGWHKVLVQNTSCRPSVTPKASKFPASGPFALPNDSTGKVYLLTNKGGCESRVDGVLPRLELTCRNSLINSSGDSSGHPDVHLPVSPLSPQLAEALCPFNRL